MNWVRQLEHGPAHNFAHLELCIHFRQHATPAENKRILLTSCEKVRARTHGRVFWDLLVLKGVHASMREGILKPVQRLGNATCNGSLCP